MQAVTALQRSPAGDLPTDRATRIVEAMRASVAAHGIAGSTFDRVAREAGVSRGLLHYYFGTKERLLVEVVRRESDLRSQSLDQAIAGARSADELIDALVRSLEEVLGEGRSAMITFYELLTLGQRNPEIGAELAELARRTRSRLADALSAGSQAGVFELRAPADAVAGFLLVLADGITIRRLSEPEVDVGPLVEQAVLAARALLV